jgi:hypothetical protein
MGAEPLGAVLCERWRSWRVGWGPSVVVVQEAANRPELLRS